MRRLYVAVAIVLVAGIVMVCGTPKVSRAGDPDGFSNLATGTPDSSYAAGSTGEHTKWVGRSLREMETVKPGMTRADLMKVFTEEGGLSTRDDRQFVFRGCPYFKVRVHFEDVGKTGSEESSSDKIVSVSQPYIQWTITD